MNKLTNKQKGSQMGFSLIELMLVVVIIGIVAAIATPNMIAARQAANQGSAKSTIRLLHLAEVIYMATMGNGSYTSNFTDLKTSGLVDDVVLTGAKSGYIFKLFSTAPTAGRGPTYSAVGYPKTISGPTRTGTARYCVSEQGVILYDDQSLNPLTADSQCQIVAFGIPID